MIKTKKTQQYDNIGKLKKHWFTILVLTFVLLFATFFTVIAISPKQDLQRRGFIPCTEVLAEKLYECKKDKWCGIQVILNNTYCDIKVVSKGLNLWVRGDQPTPWSNYIFEPELYLDEEVKEFYEQNPNIEEDMQELIELNKNLNSHPFDQGLSKPTGVD